MSAYLKPFSEMNTYSDPGSQNQTCRDILPTGVIPGVSAGFDVVEGPGKNGLHRHPEWHQLFVVISGRGTLIRGEERIPIEAPCALHIPPGTEHDVLVAEGERIEYVYVNRHMGADA